MPFDPEKLHGWSVPDMMREAEKAWRDAMVFGAGLMHGGRHVDMTEVIRFPCRYAPDLEAGGTDCANCGRPWEDHET